ncbi:MAG TPA: hypothetical protein VFE15_06545, partial [Marmoricola sp.]|nr:hypothetical protein [Marmoricola sp.]
MRGADAIRRWPSRVSSWLTAHEVALTGRTGPKGAAATVASIYILGYALPIYAAILYLSSAHIRHLAHTSDGWSAHGIIELSLNVLALVPAVIVLAREAPSWWRPISSEARWLAELKSFGLAYTAILAGSIASSLLGNAGYPRGKGAGAAWPQAISSLLAGPTEEIIVLVLPLVF